MKDYKVDMDPDFQRDHKWDDSKRSRYVEFLLRGGKSGRVIYWNHPDFVRPGCDIVRDLGNEMLLVDGKQRLTACLKFLNNEIPVFGHYFNEFDDEVDRRLALGMSGTILLMNINGLQRRADVLQWYLDINDGGVVHTRDEIERVERLRDEALKDLEEL